MNYEFNKFNNIENVQLRTYNRCALLSNLMEDGGETVAREYLNLFSDGERKQMFVMNHFIKKHGVEEVKKLVLGSHTPVEEEVHA